jgi:hypothetical protein
MWIFLYENINSCLHPPSSSLSFPLTLGFPSPPEKLIAGILGILCFVLLVAVVVTTTVVVPCKKAFEKLEEDFPF